MKNRKSLSALVAAALLGYLVTAAPAIAQNVDGDLRIGVYNDAGETFVGGGILTRVGRASWFFNPNVEYVLVDRGDLLTLNADFHYDLDPRPDLDFWLGVGPALVLRDNGRGSDETELGANLFAGVGFLPSRAVRPFLQAKLLLADETEGVLAFGIRF